MTLSPSASELLLENTELKKENARLKDLLGKDHELEFKRLQEAVSRLEDRELAGMIETGELKQENERLREALRMFGEVGHNEIGGWHTDECPSWGGAACSPSCRLARRALGEETEA